MNSFDDLTDVQLDFLKEMSNIASGNAVTALSKILDKRIDMNVASARIIDITNADKILGGPENIAVAIMTKMIRSLDGMLMLIYEKDFATAAIEGLLGEQEVDFATLTDMQKSALLEIGNIMLASYSNAINSMANMEIRLSVPMIAVDMVGSILSVPIIEEGVSCNKVIFLDGNLKIGEGFIKANLIMFPTLESLHKLMVRFGMINE